MEESQWRCERGDQSHVSVKSVELKEDRVCVKPLPRPSENTGSFLQDLRLVADRSQVKSS